MDIPHSHTQKATSPRQLYQDMLASGKITPDAAQEKVIDELNALYTHLFEPSVKKSRHPAFFRRLFSNKHHNHNHQGIYLYGDVGRGKSMLMNMFIACIPSKFALRRIHFHEFMREVHGYIFKHPDQGLEGYMTHLLGQVDILCFDEFHVNDVADAMILQRLFSALLQGGMIVISTSNYPPDRLYENGLQRARFLPFIDLIKDKMHVMDIDGDIDYRANKMGLYNTYLTPLSPHVNKDIARLFIQFSHGQAVQDYTLDLDGRALHIKASGHVALCEFSELCERPHGAADYQRLADQFSTIFVTNVPRLGYDRRNEAKRFMTLIDVLYETQNRLVISADKLPQSLYTGKDHKFEFGRTISRLNEMTSHDYLHQWAERNPSNT